MLAQLNSKQKKQVTQLQQFTCIANPESAAALLAQLGWDVQRAADAYFSGSAVMAAAPGTAAAAATNRATVDTGKLARWFATYCEPDAPDEMGPDGIQKLCDELGVAPEDPVLLVISKHMGAERMLVYTKEEFIRGMTDIRVDSVASLKARIGNLRNELASSASLRDVYAFTFKWACPPGQRSMPVDTAIALWQLLLHGRFPLLKPWCEFIEHNRKHAISKDEWMLLLDFATATAKDGIKGYDESAAWPVVIDTFVEYLTVNKLA
jgi:DCN1-like protein 1/2